MWIHTQYGYKMCVQLALLIRWNRQRELKCENVWIKIGWYTHRTIECTPHIKHTAFSVQPYIQQRVKHIAHKIASAPKKNTNRISTSLEHCSSSSSSTSTSSTNGVHTANLFFHPKVFHSFALLRLVRATVNRVSGLIRYCLVGFGLDFSFSFGFGFDMSWMWA